MPKKAKIIEEEELDFIDSQPSPSSEDHELLERMLAERLAAAKEKKKQEREKKFLEGAAKTLDKMLNESVEDVRSATDKMEEVYNKFLLEYAATEDRIYRLWAEVLKQHQAIEALVQDHLKAAKELAEDCEKNHILGLSKMKGACHQFEVVVQSFVEDSDEESDEE